LSQSWLQNSNKSNVNILDTWANEEVAGLEWFRGFMTCQKHLSIRQPEGCSLSQAMAFNKHSVSKFYGKLEEAMSRNENFANGTHLWNLDETGLKTVQNPKKVVAGKGVKHVNQATSAKKGTLVTTCCSR
jgi:hypothetical protein